MDRIKDALLTSSSGIRHLIMLAITPLVIAWSYVAIALIKNDWKWVPTPEVVAPTTVEIFTYCGLIGMIIGLAALMAAIIYWNARLWMLTFLLRSIGSIPIIGTIIGYVAEGADGSWHYDAGNDEWFSDSMGLPLILAIPVGIITGAVKCIFNLIIAIGIPVISPLVILLAIAYISEWVNDNHVALLGIGAFMLIGTIFMYIVHPILSFKHDYR